MDVQYVVPKRRTQPSTPSIIDTHKKASVSPRAPRLSGMLPDQALLDKGPNVQMDGAMIPV
jgi:hypothetical protein